jgi:hypothetical protein
MPVSSAHGFFRAQDGSSERRHGAGIMDHYPANTWAPRARHRSKSRFNERAGAPVTTHLDPSARKDSR